MYCSSIPLEHERTPYALIFLHSVYFVAAACVVSQLFFPNMLALGTTALCAIGLQPLLHRLLDENRRAIWEMQVPPVRANARLAAQFAAVFLAAFAASAMAALYFGMSADPSRSQAAVVSFRDLLMHNFAVLMSGFALSFLFSSGGLVLVLVWNALHWSQSFAAIFAAETAAMSGIVLVARSLPHLVLEAVACILAGIAGVFFGKGLVKYSLVSEELRRVTIASIYCLLIGLGLLTASCALESLLAISR